MREKIEWMLTRPLVLAYEAVIVPLGERLRAGVDSFLEQMEQRLLSYSRPWLGKLLESPDLPPEIRQVLQKVNAPEGQLEVAAVLGAVVGILIGIIQGAMQPISRLMSYFVERLVHTGRPDPATLVAMLLRGEIDNAHFESYLADLGFTDDLRDAYRETVRARIGAGELLTAMHRGEISESDVRSELHKLSYPDQDIDTILKLAPSLPGPGDLVRFALREVWRDDLRSELLSPDAPGRYYELMGKQGYARGFAEDYWASHWEIPGIRQGFEMFWRLPDFDEGDLRSLLTRLDVLPAYHDELIKIAYSVITRVDARRMYQFGILSEGEVFQSYLDQGYNPTDARRLTDLAIADAMETDRELTKADILGGYSAGMLDTNDASVMLESIGYNRDSAMYLLARIDFQRSEKLIKAEINIIEDLYKNGDITLTDVQSGLTTLGLPGRQIDLLLEEWRIEKEAKIKRPSRATLERLFKSGAIDLDDFTTTLSAIGYQDKYVDWYLRNIALERQVEIEKEEERARKEQQRVVADKRRTGYQLAKAQLDVDVAEIRAAIAASQVALIEAQNERAERLRALLPSAERAEIEREHMTVVHSADAAIDSAKIRISELREQIKRRQTRASEIRESVAGNVDIALQEELKRERLTLRTEISGIREQTAAAETAIRHIREIIITLTEPAEIDEAKADILALQTAIAEYRESIAAIDTQISEIAEAIVAAMSEARKEELGAERDILQTEVAGLEAEIQHLNTEVLTTIAARDTAKREMQLQIAMMPNADQAIDVRQHYDSLIEEIKSRIKTLQANLSTLRVQKALLTVGYRETLG